MKKIYIYFLLFFTFAANAQTPQGISYQAVARDSTGKLLSNQPIKIKFSIRDSIASGNIVYQEMHFDTTDVLGLFDLVLGQGIVLNGAFDLIDWGKNSKYLQVDLDANTGIYTSMGTQKMMSVPYALYAGKTMQTTGCIPCPSMVSSVASNSNNLNFYTAARYCTNLTENGYSDWRLPTFEEFKYLRDVIELSSAQNISCWVQHSTHIINGSLYILTSDNGLQITTSNGNGLKTICIR